MSTPKWLDLDTNNPRHCKKSCCWNPLGTCGLNYFCRCHTPMDVNQ